MTRVLTPTCGTLAEQLAGRAGNSMVGKPPTWLSTSVGKSGTLVDGCTMANSIRSFRNQGPRPPRVESGMRKDPRQPGLGRRRNSDITPQTLLKRGEIEPRTSHQGRPPKVLRRALWSVPRRPTPQALAGASFLDHLLAPGSAGIARFVRGQGVGGCGRRGGRVTFAASGQGFAQTWPFPVVPVSPWST